MPDDKPNNSTGEQTPEKKAIEVIKDPTHPEAGKGGIVPPLATRFKPGDKRQRPGRPAASASYKNWLNELQDLEPADLMAFIQAKRGPALKIAAARDILARACPGDLADFEAVCQGRMSLEDARNAGLPTDWLKKVKTRTTTDKDGRTETTVEVELKDDAHKSLDRVLDRTGGKPAQEIQHKHEGMAGLGIVVRVEGMSAPELPPNEPKRLPNQGDSDDEPAP